MSTEILPPEAKITGKRQVNAWKTIKRVIFRHSEGQGRLILVFTAGRDAERHVEFSLNSIVRDIGGEKGDPPLDQVAYCHLTMWVDGGDVGRYWRTICEFLKKDDVLSLFWGRGYDSNLNAKNHDLDHDRLTLNVQRGDEQFAFIILTPVCKNNTARTIRRGVYNNE